MMSILYKNATNVRFVLFIKNLNSVAIVWAIVQSIVWICVGKLEQAIVQILRQTFVFALVFALMWTMVLELV